MRNYLHYSPEFNSFVVMGRKYKKWYRNAFVRGLDFYKVKGFTPLVFIAVDDFGFM